MLFKMQTLLHCRCIPVQELLLQHNVVKNPGYGPRASRCAALFYAILHQEAGSPSYLVLDNEAGTVFCCTEAKSANSTLGVTPLT